VCDGYGFHCGRPSLSGLPGKLKICLIKISTLPDKTLRAIGISAILLGLVLLYFGRRCTVLIDSRLVFCLFASNFSYESENDAVKGFFIFSPR